MAEPTVDLHQPFTLSGLILRPFGQLDDEQISQIWQMRNHPEIARWMGTGGGIPFEVHLAFMAHQKTDRDNVNYLCHDATGIAGVVSLHRLDWDAAVAWLGIYRNPARTDKPLGGTLLTAICQLAFEVALLQRLRLEVVADNARAIAAYRKAGFLDEGVRRNAVFRESQERYMDLVLMGIQAQEWRRK